MSSNTYDELNEIAPIFDIRDKCKDKTVVIIGDIHGCYDELQVLLKRIDWNPDSHILIFVGDFIDRGPKIKESLLFALKTPNTYSVMSNHEYKLLKYLRGLPVRLPSLTKTINQCGTLLTDPMVMNWLESLPYVIRWSDDSYVVHAGIIPSDPINKKKKETCIYIRSWNPITRDIIGGKKDKRWFEFPLLPSEDKIRIYFGHQVYPTINVSDYAIALDGGVATGGKLRACINGNEMIEISAKEKYHGKTKKTKFVMMVNYH